MKKELKGRVIVAGFGEGPALISKERLSFWGGVDPSTGEIIDRRHDRSGDIITGKVFVFPKGRGSSTGSAVLMETVMNNTAPAAIINSSLDTILALGAVIAEELYQRTTPIVVLSQPDIDLIKENDHIVVYPDGLVEIQSVPHHPVGSI